MTSTSKILIVDSDPAMVSWLESSVESLGHQFQSTTSYSEALGALETFAPDVVLCDMQPDSDSGLSLLESSRTAATQPKFIFLSAKGNVEIAVECLKRGAVDFLTKPVQEQLLAKAIADALKHSPGDSQSCRVATGASLREELEARELQLILDALQRNGWVKSKAASELRLEPSHLHYKIKKYGISKP
jgi:DNA-binding NtrC family response regulator